VAVLHVFELDSLSFETIMTRVEAAAAKTMITKGSGCSIKNYDNKG